jgi:hypothetical protein
MSFKPAPLLTYVARDDHALLTIQNRPQARIPASDACNKKF